MAAPRRVGFDLDNRELAFVLTDIESSTELSSRDGRAFKQVGSDGCGPLRLDRSDYLVSSHTSKATSHACCTPCEQQVC